MAFFDLLTRKRDENLNQSLNIPQPQQAQKQDDGNFFKGLLDFGSDAYNAVANTVDPLVGSVTKPFVNAQEENFRKSSEGLDKFKQGDDFWGKSALTQILDYGKGISQTGINIQKHPLETAKDATRGVINFGLNLPAKAGSFVQAYGDTTAEQAQKTRDTGTFQGMPEWQKNASLAMGNPLPHLSDWLVNQTPGVKDRLQSEDVKQNLTKVEGVGQDIAESGKDFRKGIEQSVEESRFGISKAKDPVAFQLGSGGASMAASIATTLVTKNPELASILFGGIQGADVYSDARDRGVAPSQALPTAIASGTAEGILEKVGLEQYLKPGVAGQGVLSTIARRGITEASQEGAQEFAGNIAKRTYDPNQNIFENVIPSALYGGTLGVVGSGPTTIAQNMRGGGQQTTQTPTIDQLTQQAAPGTVQGQKQFSQNLLDNAAQQYRAGQIDEKQLRAIARDAYEQQFNKAPMPADIAGYTDPIMGITNRPYVQNVAPTLVGQPSPLQIDNQNDVNEVFNQPRDSAGRYGSIQTNDVEINALKEYQRGLIQQFQNTPQNSPTYRGIVKNYNDAQARIDALERNLPAPKPVQSKPVNELAPKADKPEMILRKAGYKQDANGDWIDPTGKPADIGEIQQLIQNPELTRAEEKIAQGKETYGQAEAETTQLAKNKDANPFVLPATNKTDITKVPRSDLEYFTQKGYTSITDVYGNTIELTPKASNSKSDPLEALKAEARKYKSAEEFVKAQEITPALRVKKELNLGQKSYKLPEVIQNKELFKKYPQLENVNVKFVGSKRIGNGYTDGSILVNPRYYKEVNGRVKLNEDGIKVLYHEIQHAKQVRVKGYQPKPVEDTIAKYASGTSQESYLKNPLEMDARRAESKYLTKQQLTDLYNQANKPSVKPKTIYETVPKGTFDNKNTPDPAEVDRYAQSFGVSKQEATKQLQEIANPESPGQAPATPAKQQAAQKASGTTIKTLEGQQASPIADTSSPDTLKQLEAKNFTDAAAERIGYKVATKTPKKFLITKALEGVTGGRVHNLMQLSLANRASNKLGDAINRAASQSIAGGDTLGSKAVRAVRQVYSQFGLDPYLRTVEAISNGNKRNASWLAGKAKEQVDQLKQRANPTIEETNKRLDQFFSEQDWLEKYYGKDTKKLTYEELNPTEQQIADMMIQFNKERNASLYAVGQLDTPGFEFGKDGMHTPRIYGFTKEQVDNMPKGGLDTNAVKHRKDVDDIAQDVFDQQIESPTDRMLMRWEVAMHNQAVNDMMKTFDENGLLLDKQPNKSYTQLTGRQYGEYEGKWADPTIRSHIDGELIFTSKGGQAVNNLIQAYKGTLLGRADRFQKKLKTVFSPGTILGNIMSNLIAFQSGAGVSTIRQIPGMVKAATKLARFGSGEWDAEIYQANQMGVFTSNTGKSLVGEPGVDNVNESLERRNGNGVQSEFQRNKQQSILKKGYRWATAAYGGVDNAARFSAYKILQQKGLTPQQASAEVGKFAQDYDNVGNLIQTISDSPLLGKPFARFGPELVRIMKNNVTRAPVKLTARLAFLAMVINIASGASGETPEEREARETGVGQTLLPGTAWLNKLVGGPDRDISLNIPMGNVAVNIARSSGLNFPLEPGKDPSTALLEQLLPVEIPTRKNAQGQEVFDPTKLVTSLTLRPFMEQLFNTNFIGRSITDPKQRTYYESGDYKVNKWAGEPSMVEQIGNRFRALAVSLAPLGNEIDSLYAGITGNETLSGKKRTLDQSIWRVFGIKTQDNTPEARQIAVEMNQYFSGKVNDTNQFLNANPDLAAAYYEYNNPTKDRVTGKKVSNLVSPEKWNILRNDTSGRLFGFVRDQAIKDNQRDGKPIDPIFNLAGDPDKLRQALEIRSRPTGDDMETEERLRATQPWYNQFEAAERQYYKDNQAFFEKMKAKGVDLDTSQNDRVKAYNAIPYPEQSDVIKQYYAIKAQNPEAGKQFYKAYAGLLSDQFTQYKQQRLDYVNAKRAIEGFPPISPTEWNNVTFGYEADEAKVAKELYYKQLSGSGYGRGYGRRSGGGVNQPFLSVDSPNVGKLKVPGGPKMLSVSPGRKVAVVKNPWKKVGNRSRA